MTRMDRTDDFAPTVSAWLHEDARASRAGRPRRRPAPDSDRAPAAGMVEPRKVAPDGYRRVSNGVQPARVRPRTRAPDRPRAADRWPSCAVGIGSRRAASTAVWTGAERRRHSERRWRHPCGRPEDGQDLAAHRGPVVRLRPDILARRHEVPVPPRPRRSRRGYRPVDRRRQCRWRRGTPGHAAGRRPRLARLVARWRADRLPVAAKGRRHGGRHQRRERRRNGAPSPRRRQTGLLPLMASAGWQGDRLPRRASPAERSATGDLGRAPGWDRASPGVDQAACQRR